MGNAIQLSKIDAALQQIETAIILWSEYKDPVSIHTLAHAAYQILYDLNKHQNGPCMTPDSDLVNPAMLKDWKKSWKEWSNFLKHAEKDHNKTISFNPDINDMLLVDVVSSFSRITKKTSPTLQCFFTWMVVHHPPLNEVLYNIVVEYDLIDNILGMDRNQYFCEYLPKALSLSVT
jgi:hypothetical protein